MLAIENTIAGSLLHNNELLRQSGAQIVGEYKLRISTASFACRRRLGRHYGSELPPHRPDAMPRVPRTASPHQSGGRRRHRPQCGDHQKREPERHAAICSKPPTERYGMKVLQEGIETNKHNFTRFLVVADPWQVDELNRHRNKEVNKASMYSHFRIRKEASRRYYPFCLSTAST